MSVKTIKTENDIRKRKLGLGMSRALFIELYGRDTSIWRPEPEMDITTFDKIEGITVKSSLFTTVVKVTDPETGDIFYFKEFHDRGPMDKLRAFFRDTRSRRAFHAGISLIKKGFLTPSPLLHGIEKHFCFPHRNFLITRAIEGERTYQYFTEKFPVPASAKTVAGKRLLIRAAGHEIGRLHHEGISHGDLRVGNILIHGEGNSAKFYFIDNERTRSYKIIPMRKRLKNLVQLNMILLPQITRTDRLRFLEAYLKENPELIPDRKKMIRRIALITKKRHHCRSAENYNVTSKPNIPC